MHPDDMPINTQRDVENLPHTESLWRVELTTTCPYCHEQIDLLDDTEFLSDTEIQLAEHHTERTRNVFVVCVECGEEFTTTLEY